MPPTSRGLLLLRTWARTPSARPCFPRSRHASSKFKIPETLRPKQKLEPSAPAAQPAPPPPKPPHWAKVLSSKIRHNVLFQATLLVLPWLPIIAVGIHHWPLSHHFITGPSMQPTFNPSYNEEAGILNTRTHVLVLKQNFGNTSLSRIFSDFFRSTQYRQRDNTVQRGEIVVYRAPHNPERLSVKRVVGIPGDRVTPLPGYPGGDETVIVPFNHLWLEGDIGDKNKSIDSNWLGPISANLVVGTVKLILPSFARIDWENATYPAQGRVEMNVVHQADPDEVVRREAFLDGRAAEDLQVVKAYPLDRPLTKMERQVWESMHRHAVAERDRKDTVTYELASELEAELRVKLTTKVEKITLKNVDMSKEEFAKFQKDGVVPESVLARSNLGGT